MEYARYTFRMLVSYNPKLLHLYATFFIFYLCIIFLTRRFVIAVLFPSLIISFTFDMNEHCIYELY